MDLVLMLLGLVAGAGFGLQAGLNNALRASVGRPEWAALVNFGVGLVALAACVVVLRLPWPAGALSRAPWWKFGGGFLGAFYVYTVVLLTPRLGVATTLALSVAAQMTVAVLLDHLGGLGVEVRHVTGGRVIGVAMLIAGVVLVRR